MKNTLRASLRAIVVGSMVLGMMLVPHDTIADDHGPEEPLCLAVADGRTVIFTLQVPEPSQLNPGQDEQLIVKALANNAEPVLGLAVTAGRNNTLVNLQGTVAGFFTAMHFTYNPGTGKGTGRVIGELQSHPSVTVIEVQCK